jgi:hypothetical protein
VNAAARPGHIRMAARTRAKAWQRPARAASHGLSLVGLCPQRPALIAVVSGVAATTLIARLVICRELWALSRIGA